MKQDGQLPARSRSRKLTRLLKKCSRAFSLVRRRVEDCWGEEERWPRKEPCGDEQRGTSAAGGQKLLNSTEESRRALEQQNKLCEDKLASLMIFSVAQVLPGQDRWLLPGTSKLGMTSWSTPVMVQHSWSLLRGPEGHLGQFLEVQPGLFSSERACSYKTWL